MDITHKIVKSPSENEPQLHSNKYISPNSKLVPHTSITSLYSTKLNNKDYFLLKGYGSTPTPESPLPFINTPKPLKKGPSKFNITLKPASVEPCSLNNQAQSLHNFADNLILSNRGHQAISPEQVHS